ncbi:MAG TPA: dihydrolipoyl dehydrogenase [Phycisphaerae bacterium]|nr:dihydrolipoyl dehydrogenase [Phycisphaerae bacterium]
MTDQASGQTQLAVIGAGPGGYAAAFHAAELGMQVTLISQDAKPGGVCLLRGCIPSKSLLHIAKLIYEARDADGWGVKFAEPNIDLDALRSWKDSVVTKLTDGLLELCKRRNVRFVHARGRFEDSHTLRLQGASGPVEGAPERLRFEHAIVATGSLPAVPGALSVEDPRVMDSTGALALEDIPKRLLVVGGGYIGLEMGTVYAALGSEVTLVELTDGLLPGVDRDLVRALRPRLAERFKSIHLNAQVEKFEPQPEGIAATFKGQDIQPTQTFDRVLVAVGRRPASQNVGLENTQVKVNDRGFVQVDRQMRTADPAIRAIGDVVGEPMVAHKASREAKVAVEVIAGKKSEFDNVAIPAVVFTDPEVAWCGLTETQAKASGQQVKVARFPWAASGRAATLGRTDGLTKLIFDPETQRLLGMGVVGPGAGELIAEGVLAVEMAAVAADVAESIHPHPTLSETVMESAESLFGHATHLFRPKR